MTKIDFTADDLLVSVLASFPNERGEKINGVNKINSAFYEASKKVEYKEFFSNVHYDIDGAWPYSREFAGAYELIIGMDGIITEFDTSYFEVGGYIYIQFNNYIKPHLNEEQLKLLEKMAQEIQEFLEN